MTSPTAKIALLRARAGNPALDDTRARALAIADALADALANDVAIAGILAGSSRGLVDLLARAHDHARSLARALADDRALTDARRHHARGLTVAITDARHTARGHSWPEHQKVHDREFVRTLGSRRDDARQLVALVEALTSDGARAAQAARERVSAVALRLTGWVVRVLPAVHRDDYREIFRSELDELARGPRPRRAQIIYAMRVVLRAVVLRHELAAPAPAQRERSW